MVKSSINPILTLEYMINEDKNKIFDRKSAQLKPSDIADEISAYANAEGGTIVFGISDKTRRLEGINAVGAEKINNFINAPMDCCNPTPEYQEEFLDIENAEGQADRLLLLHIYSSVDRVISTSNGSVFLRIGDRKRELKGDDLRKLEYSKGSRHYEDELNYDAKILDLDEELIKQYKEILGNPDIPTEQLLSSRGFMREQKGEKYLTNAAVLLFAQNIYQFYPNCRIRFVRYTGTSAGVGTQMNIIKDTNIEYPILKIVEEAKKFIAVQLREFTSLDAETGNFKTVDEYPPFAWTEGIVNAVAHREYAMEGKYIKVTMYDDRLEIESPGKLPNIVTVDNIRTTNFSRNPRMARVLADFGIVKELNEGVKRIYSDMADYFLDAPEYSEPSGQTVKSVLRNNIIARAMGQTESTEKKMAKYWGKLDTIERDIVTIMGSRNCITATELSVMISKTRRTVNKKINHLLELKIIKMNGNKHDPALTYSLNI
ncbi:MAG: putative DNA binding domain-containing protein [Clostridium sp.]|nr:putative DNA binding domain-containing protein [Clostridium sp.]